MGITAWIIVGVAAVMISKLIMPGKGPGGFIAHTITVISGAIGGGWIIASMGRTTVTGLNLHSLFVAVIGSCVLLFLYHTVAGKQQMKVSPVVNR